MYKVFVNDKPIILTDSLPKENKYHVYLFKNLIVSEILKKLTSNSVNGVLIFCDNLERSKELFFKNFKIISAAGGLVLNPKKEVLLIYRNNIWDLPKGWIEKNESIETAAIREVEEECGIFNLKIIKPLTTTYHIYNQKGFMLKQTHWFLMTSDYERELVPQIEEGITKVIFKNKKATNEALKNSYANIKLVYDTYREG
ncbi:MAG: NUDIX domain-containing protein [Polaribacter sp.]|jgi:ADP-ribose pyrophosphatase YjhB (NUDIX family)|nr:NUDIX domain-containing protein [Polaribacter sp.]MDG2356799.1 NUDIX domain-containing protein [Polaribacter sp.]